MSATNRSDVREPDDFYSTPPWVTRAILPHLRQPGGLILDPCCGDGAILDVVANDPRFEQSPFLGIEKHVERAAKCDAAGFDCIVGDALDLDWGSPSLIIQNPPFRLAMEFVQKAISSIAPGGEVAVLLRINWLGSMKRMTFHRDNVSDLFVLPKRPSFTPDGKTDATEYAWFLFGKDHEGRVHVLQIEETS